MYPAAMTLPMPNGPCVTVALPEENAARLSWLHKTCLLLVAELHDHLDWAPPARMKVGKGLYGPHTADMAERLGLSPSPCEKLVPFLGMHVEEGVDGKRLKFLQDVLGARVWRLHRAYRFACSPFMAGFMELKRSERRQLKSVEKVVKLTQNAIFGRCYMNPDKFRNERLRGPSQVRAGRGQELRDELQAPDQRLGGVPGLRGDAQDGPQQGLHERCCASPCARRRAGPRGCCTSWSAGPRTPGSWRGRSRRRACLPRARSGPSRGPWTCRPLQVRLGHGVERVLQLEDLHHHGVGVREEQPRKSLLMWR